MKSKRISKKTQSILQSVLFFTSTLAIISCLIIYLWTYTEIDETMLSLDIYNSTANEFQNEIYELQSEIELLERVDIIAKKARNELKMVFTEPETLNVIINSGINQIL